MPPPRASVADVAALSANVMVSSEICTVLVPMKMPPPLLTARLPRHSTCVTLTELAPLMYIAPPSTDAELSASVAPDMEARAVSPGCVTMAMPPPEPAEFPRMAPPTTTSAEPRPIQIAPPTPPLVALLPTSCELVRSRLLSRRRMMPPPVGAVLARMVTPTRTSDGAFVANSAPPLVPAELPVSATSSRSTALSRLAYSAAPLSCAALPSIAVPEPAVKEHEASTKAAPPRMAELPDTTVSVICSEVPLDRKKPPPS
mmetsp:Transcript_15932/g.55484  ORF Transcript_15932/g.55484 Transcript_15932/m.55484 type:complete len:258 (-) Transcript_15932:13816-14589(-)